MSVSAKVFYSYAHEDEELRNKLETHLAILRRSGLISEWHDRRISPGARWGRLIDDHVNAADLIILLISPDFLASDYCHEIEMRRALERDASGEVRVIPVILRPVDWKGAPFENLQLLPTNGKAITCWQNIDEAFADVARGIRRVIDNRTPKLLENSVTHPAIASSVQAIQVARSLADRAQLGSASRVEDPDVSPRLQALLRAPLHSYHLTLNGAGIPIWSYAILNFEKGNRNGTLLARVVHLPDSACKPAKRIRHEYECEASFDHNHLLLRTYSPDAADDDIFTRVFPSAARRDFPLCGVGFIAHTWNDHPASTISILTDDQLECAIELPNGGCTSKPQIVQALQAEWDKAAQQLQLARLPRGLQMHTDWDKFLELLSRVERNENDNVDLRIVTIAFTDLGVPEGKLMWLARNGLRIKILLTHPQRGDRLVRARNKIRWRYDSTTPESALDAIKTQARRLQECKDTLKEFKLKGCRGDLDFALSDMFPYAFAAISDKFAILGLFLATGSYAEYPMIVVDFGTNKEFCETLKREWDARWDDAIAQQPGKHDPLEEARRGSEPILSDTRLITAIEARTADNSDIWVAAPDLSNVGDATSSFSELVRSTVHRNAQRGVNYSYIVPYEWAGRFRIEYLRECFIGTPGRLCLYTVPPDRFLEFTLVPSHFISFGPLSVDGKTYMQLPLSQPEKGWIKLDANARSRINAKMRELMNQYPQAV